MLRSMKALIGYAVKGADGRLGAVHDFFIDDAVRAIRYLVVDTGELLPGRKVLLAQSALKEPEWAKQCFPVHCTREQIENSPSVDTNKPVSRQDEQRLHDYFQWIPYWTGYGAAMSPLPVAPVPRYDLEDAPSDDEAPDPHLRSLKEILDYRLHATDGLIGSLEDLIFSDKDWRLRLLVADTGHWLPGRLVLLTMDRMERIVWREKEVRMDLTKEQIEDAPAWDPAAPVNETIERRLYDYYGRPHGVLARVEHEDND